MPITLGNITYTAFANGLAVNYLKTPWRTSVPRKKYPVDGNSSLWFIEEEYMILTEFYVRPVDNLRHPTESSTFWVKDSDLNDVGPGVSKFTRTWALLPGAVDKGYTHTEPESFNFTVPSIRTTQQLFYQFPAISAVTSNGYTTVTAQVGSTWLGQQWNDLDVEVGKPAAIGYRVYDPKSGQPQARWATVTPIAVTTNTVTFPVIKDIGKMEFTAVQKANVQQTSYVKTVASKIETSYWIVGVNCTSMEDIPIINQFEIIENDGGSRVDYLSETTRPTIDEYRDLVANKEYICVESSVIRRWSGNIFSKTERYVRATT